MRVLHIHNVAGVSSLLARHMDRQFATQSLVVTRKALDRYALTDYGVVWECGATEFAIRCLLKARWFDIVHVHDFDKMVGYLKFLYSRKPVVLEYHSHRFMNGWSERGEPWRRADRVLVSTPNLLGNAPSGVTLLPNPVEVARFRHLETRVEGTAAYFIKHKKDEEVAEVVKKEAAAMGLVLQVFDVRKQAIPHEKMPSVIGKLGYLFDQHYCNALSKTALEALAQGCKVVRWDGQVVEGLPPEHLPETSAAKLHSIYRELLGSGDDG